MNQIETEIKKMDDNTINEIAEELQVVYNAKIKTQTELLNQLIAKDVVRNKIINVPGQLFFEYENELDESQQRIKCYENYFDDDKIKYGVLKRVLQNNEKKSENVDDYRNRSKKRFIIISCNIKRELQILRK